MEDFYTGSGREKFWLDLINVASYDHVCPCIDLWLVVNGKANERGNDERVGPRDSSSFVCG